MHRPCRRKVAAAVGDDHHAQRVELRGAPRIADAGAPGARPPPPGTGEMPGLPELPRAGIQRIDRELRRHQHGVEVRLRQLPRHLLAPPHIALQRRLVAVEVDDDQSAPSRIEALGDEDQHAAGRCRWCPPSRRCRRAVVAPRRPSFSASRNGLSRPGGCPSSGEGRGLEGDELELCGP